MFYFGPQEQHGHKACQVGFFLPWHWALNVYECLLIWLTMLHIGLPIVFNHFQLETHTAPMDHSVQALRMSCARLGPGSLLVRVLISELGLPCRGFTPPVRGPRVSNTF